MLVTHTLTDPRTATLTEELTTLRLSVRESASVSDARRDASPRGEEETANRKIALLKRSGLFGQDTKGAVIERACSFEDLREAYRLVHHVFLGTGYIGAEPSGVRLRIFEMTSDTATFIAKIDGRVVGVLSVVGDSPDLGLPSDSAFKPELDALRATGARLCEVTNQAVAEDFRKSAVPTQLMQCAIALMMHAGYNEAVASVSPSHNGFYDLLAFRKLGSERSYSDKLHDPVVALSLNVDQYRSAPESTSETRNFIHNYLTVGNRFREHVADWARQAKRHFLNPELLEQLFIKERNFLAECTPAQLKILQRRWGQELFSVVTGVETLALASDMSDDIPTLTARVLGLDRTPVLDPAPDAVVLFAGQLYALLSFAKERVGRLFSVPSVDDAGSWTSFESGFAEDSRQEFALSSRS